MKYKSLRLPSGISKILVGMFFAMVFLFVMPVSAEATNKFWVGGTGNWSDNTNHWSLTTGGSPGATVPSSADDVFFDANSFSGAGQVVTVDSVQNARNMTWTGATNSPRLTLNNGLNIYGSMTLISTMTWTGGLNLIFLSTSTGNTITTAGVAINSTITFNGVGGGWTLQDSLNNTAGTLILTTGTLNMGSFTHNISKFQSNSSGVRTLTMNSSTINLTDTVANNTLWAMVSPGNLTITSNTATIAIANRSVNQKMNFSIDMNGASLSITNLTAGLFDTGTAGATFANFTLTGSGTFASAENLTFTGTATMTGTSISSRLYFGNGNTSNVVTRGTSRTISAAVWSLSNVDFEDINATGAGTFSTSAIVGDLGGNSGTFAGRTPATYYWEGDTGSYSDTTKWSLTSGGASASTIPLPQDTARFDANSFSTTGRSVSFDVLRIGGFDFTGATNNPATTYNSTAKTVYGSITLISAMSLPFGTQTTLTMAGRGTTTINWAAQTAFFNPIGFDTITGTVNQLNNMGATGNQITSWQLISGTYNTNNYNIFTASFGSNNSNIRALNLGSSIITIPTGSGGGIAFTNPTNLTLNSGTSSIIATPSGGYSPHFGGLTWYDVQFLGTQTVTLDASSTFHSLRSGSSARIINFTAGTTQTITSANGFIIGTSGNVQTLQSTSNGSPWTVTAPGLQQSSDYLSLRDSTATQTGTWFAGTHSTNVLSSNTNWIFTDPTGPNTPSSLGPVNLVDGSLTNQGKPQLTFTLSDPDAGDTNKYQIQIDNTADFSSPIVDYTSALMALGSASFTVGQSTGGGTYTVGSSGQVLGNGPYYWRVKAIDAGGLSSAYATANSGAIAFNVNTNGPAPSVQSLPAPQSCNDSTPGTAPDLFRIDTYPNSVTLNFKAVNGVNSYQYSYGLSPDANQYGDSSSFGGNLWLLDHTIGGLADNTTYYFKIKAVNGCNAGSYSQTVSAKTGTQSLAGVAPNTQPTPQPQEGGQDLVDTISKVPVVQNLVEKNIEFEKFDLNPKPQQHSPLTYVVQQGDNLWSIAKKLLGDGSKYLQLIELNKEEHPELGSSQDLTPGWKLKVDGIDLTDDEIAQIFPDSNQKKEYDGYDLDIKVLADGGAPLKGVKVTLHSTPMESQTNDQGIASFKNVEKGAHKVYLAFNGYNGEQAINVTGENKDLELVMEIKLTDGFSSPMVIGVISTLSVVILIMAFIIFKNRKKLRT